MKNKKINQKKKDIETSFFVHFHDFWFFETTFWLSSAIKAFVLVEIDTLHYLHIILDKMYKQVTDTKRHIFKKVRCVPFGIL